MDYSRILHKPDSLIIMLEPKNSPKSAREICECRNYTQTWHIRANSHACAYTDMITCRTSAM